MPYELQETGNLTRLAEVTVPKDEYEGAVNSALRKLSGRVKIRGFRKGKIPLPVLRQRYGDAVQRDVIEEMVRKYLDEIIEETSEVIYIAQPEVTAVSTSDVGLAFKVVLELRPQVDPVGYLGLEIEKPAIEVAEEDIEDRLEQMREQYATLEPIEHRTEVADGDTVTFDFKALDTDNEALADFKGEDVQVVMGEGNSIAGIEEALKGAKFGSSVTATLTPDDDFPVEELRGVTFDINIDIKSVKRRVLPELDDDFAVDTGEAETFLALRAKIREEIGQQQEHSAMHFAQDNLIEKLLETHDFELPPQFVNEQIDNAIRQQLQQLGQQGMDVSQLNIDFSTIRDGMREEKESQLRAEFLIMAIAEKEGLKVEEADIKKYIEHQSMHAGVSPEQYMRFIQQDRSRLQQVSASALFEKTLNKLLDDATVNEISWDEVEKRREAEEKAKAEKAAADMAKMNAEKAEAPKKEAKADKPKKEAKKDEPKKEAPKKESKKAAKAVDVDALEALTVSELKDLLRDNDLKVGGKKSELIERLVEAGISA